MTDVIRMGQYKLEWKTTTSIKNEYNGSESSPGESYVQAGPTGRSFVSLCFPFGNLGDDL